MAKTYTLSESKAAGLTRLLNEKQSPGLVPIARPPREPFGLKTSPTTISSAAEGSESASSTTWDRDTDKTPLDLWVQTRTAYFHAGDKKLYGYFRKLSYDSTGRLYAVSAETRVEIDAAESC